MTMRQILMAGIAMAVLAGPANAVQEHHQPLDEAQQLAQQDGMPAQDMTPMAQQPQGGMSMPCPMGQGGMGGMGQGGMMNMPMMGQGMMGQGGMGMMCPGMMGQGGMMNMPMMGHGMMGQGGMGMMHPGMMGQGSDGDDAMAQFMAERVEGRIAFLRAELMITDQQQAQWDGFAEALRANAKSMMESRAAMMSGGAPQTLLDRLDRQEKILSTRLAGIAAVKASLGELYSALSAEQKKAADELLAHPMFFGRMAVGGP